MFNGADEFNLEQITKLRTKAILHILLYFTLHVV